MCMEHVAEHRKTEGEMSTYVQKTQARVPKGYRILPHYILCTNYAYDQAGNRLSLTEALHDFVQLLVKWWDSTLT